MKKLYLLLLILAVSGVTWLLWWGCGSGLAEPLKNWIHEDEFTVDRKLRARPNHTVVLQLEQGASKVQNSIPYVFEERAKYNFCIDEDDPLIDSMKLVNGEGKIVASVNKKKRCVTKTIGKGRYRMYIYHDGKAVGDGLQYAFIHHEKAPLPLGKNNPWAGPFPADAQSGAPPFQSSEAGTVGDPLRSSGYWTIEASNGLPLRSLVLQEGSQQPLGTTRYIDHAPWHIPVLGFSLDPTGLPTFPFGCSYEGDDANYYTNECVLTLTAPDMHFLEVHVYNPAEDSRCNDFPLQPNCYWPTVTDLGNYQFRIWLDAAGDYHGGFVMLCDDGRLVTGPWGGWPQECSVSNPDAAIIFTLAAITGLPAAQVTAGSLQKGQVALYDQPDCAGTATVVMPGHHVFWVDAFSVRMAHDTRATLYSCSDCPALVLNRGLKCINKNPWVVEAITVESALDILISTKKCQYCDLYGLSLQNMTLDGFDFSYAYLVNARFNNSSMKGVNLSHAVLAGAQFDQANLEGSNMCSAFLQGNDEVTTAARLDGAYMKNVNLSGANLSGVSMIYTDFYNTGALPCQASCVDTQMTSACATAAGATMNGTQATPAYLARTDFSGIKTTGANFSGSILVGANFSNAQLQTDINSTASTNFGHAFLQGADFSGASVANASFNSAYVDADASGTDKKHLGFQIEGGYTSFTGFWYPPGSLICVDNAYSKPTQFPATDSNNICPDGHSYSDGCTEDAWTHPSTPLNKAEPKAGYGLCPCDPFGAYCGDETWSE